MPALISRRWSGPPQTLSWHISTTPEAAQRQVAPMAIYLRGQSGKALGLALFSCITIHPKAGAILQQGRPSLPRDLCFCALGLLSVLNEASIWFCMWKGTSWHMGVGYLLDWDYGYQVSSNYRMLVPPCKQKQRINSSNKMFIVRCWTSLLLNLFWFKRLP